MPDEPLSDVAVATVIELLSALTVALTKLPCRTEFSRFAPSVGLTFEYTVSVPAPAPVTELVVSVAA